jgi:cysteine synthase
VIFATEPAESPILPQGIARKHRIMGTAPGFIPEILDPGIHDEVTAVSAEDA